jgi:tetratricopeptide (TPR) repeat protein
MHLQMLFSRLIASLKLSSEVWLSILLGAIVTVIIAYIIYRVQKKESSIHKHDHDARFDKLEQLHQQDSEKIKVLYELIMQSQKGSLGEIESVALEQKIEVAAEQITEQDSDKAQALKAIADKDKDKADDLLDKIAEQEHNLVEMYQLRAVNEARHGYFAESVKWYRKILELQPDNFIMTINLMVDLINTDQREEAHKIGKKLLAEMTARQESNPANLMLLYRNLVESYTPGVYDETREQYLSGMIDLARQHYGENSKEMLDALYLQAVSFHPDRTAEEVEKIYLKCLSIIDSGNITDDNILYKIFLQTAQFYFQHRRFAEAIPLLDKSKKVIIRFLGPDNPELAVSSMYRANIHTAQGEFQAAETLYQQAMELIEPKLGTGHRNYILCKASLVQLYFSMRRFPEAEKINREMIDTLSSREVDNRYFLGIFYFNLGISYHFQEKYEEAGNYFEKSLAERENLLDEKHPEMIGLLLSLNSNYLKRGEYAKAEQGLLKVIRLYEEMGMDKLENMAVARNNLASTYKKQERYAEAEPYARQALDFFQEQMPDTQNCVRNLINYAEILNGLGRTDEAEKYRARSDELKAKLEAAYQSQQASGKG